MLRHVGDPDQALIDEILDFGVILRRADQASLAKQIKTRIACVRPIRVSRLDDDGDACCARRFQHGKLIRVRTERRVRTQHRFLQELERIAQHRLGFLLKPLDEQADADLRSDFTAGVTAHAVGDDQQKCVPAVRIREPVLVDPARAFARVLEDREPHTSKD